MNAYYALTEKLYDLLISDPEINTVTKGDPTRIDFEKKNIFPLAHVSVALGGFDTQRIYFFVDVFAMNLRDMVETPTTDKYIGNDNEDDNLNAMFYVLLRLYLQLEKNGGDFFIESIADAEPFTEARHNIADGWVQRYQIGLPIENTGAC